MTAFEKGKMLTHVLMCSQDFETYREIQAAAPKDTVNVEQIEARSLRHFDGTTTACK